MRVPTFAILSLYPYVSTLNSEPESVTFFKRMFSADFRRAVAAEAAGDYAEAARAYALAGEKVKVAEMHLLRAERAPSPGAKLHELRAAIRWADLDEPDGPQARRRIARALFAWAKTATLVSDAEKSVVRDAAQLFGDVGDHVGAGECHEFVGDELAAAEAYQRAGDVERLESVLSREEHRRKLGGRVREAFEEYKMALASGERDRALEAIRQCAESPLPPLSPTMSADRQAEMMRDRASYQRLREELEAKLVADGSVLLRAGAVGHARERRYVAAFPLVMGRDASCQLSLRDAGISRQHAEIVAADDGGFALRDHDSKNGTTLAGVRIAGTLPIAGEGDLGLGELCVIHYVVQGDTLTLEVTRGLDRGLRVVAGRGALDVEGVGELQFIDGRPRLGPIGGRLLYLNGVHAGFAVQLIRGDVVELGEQRLEVG
ncbi:MAG: domain containing protein [Myxococcales bacterium]|nr:domain containing protein [Myxococcales bacterium]